ncbi:hypothetical protein [Cerasicoccus maritimus]|uniref:hypothetical protein n=1 Tax=Cerasicoccus maritimus TaxID=490089 RepID=UPI002852DA27|nr:hypothetical protein [Cerasicoccus maritimus]
MIDLEQEEFWLEGSDTGTLTQDSELGDNYVFWSFYQQEAPFYGMNLPSGVLYFPDSFPVDGADTGTPVNYSNAGAFEMEYVTASIAEQETNSGNKFGAFGVVGRLHPSGELTITGAGYAERVSYSDLHDKSFFEAMIGQSVPYVVNPNDPQSGWSNLEVVAGVPEPAFTTLIIAGVSLIFVLHRVMNGRNSIRSTVTH